MPTAPEPTTAPAEPLKFQEATVDLSLTSIGDLLTMGQRFSHEAGDVYALSAPSGMFIIDVGRVLSDRVRVLEKLPRDMFIRPVPTALLELVDHLSDVAPKDSSLED
jgi:hypothetical protein